jgi:HNH endonuclease
MLDKMLGPGCAICDEPITAESESREHAIPAAIGGRLKVRGFICRRCNSDSGSTWDAKLVSQLHPLSLMFGVERQRGSAPRLPIITTAGEELVINPEGGFTPTRPSFFEETGPEGVKIQITARSMKEAKRMLAGVKRKYPNVNVDRILADAQMSTSYPKGLVHHRLEFGGEVSGRSIVKSVLAMARHAGVPASVCHDALDYLRDPAAVPCFGYYQATDLVIDRPAEVPLNCLSVEANPDTGLILGYAEYFGVHRVVVCLGRRYAGDRVQACYAIDPRTGVQLDLSIRLGFSEAEIEAIYDYKMIPDGAIQEAFAKVMPAAIKKQFEAERDRVTREATEYAFANCGAKPGEMLTEEHVKKLSRLVAEKLTPFILHNLARPQVPPSAEQGEAGGKPGIAPKNSPRE